MEPTTTQRWIGRVLSTIAVLFLLMDAVMKLLHLPMVVDATAKLGYAESHILPIGITLLVCTVLYVIPRTDVLGAVLLTRYLGGAVASNVRAGNPLFSHVLFPVYVGAFIWAGLLLRQRKLRALLGRGI